MKLQVKSKRLGGGGSRRGRSCVTPAGGNTTWSGGHLKAEVNIRAGPASGMCAGV